MDNMRHISVFALAVVFLTACGQGRTINRSCWMTGLPDSTLACMMSIPGAHDACTAGVDNAFAPFFQTQLLDIAGLWDAGVRSFDIRPSARGEHLGIFHQVADTHESFEGVFNILADKLRAHPGEFAVVIFRHEPEGDISDNFDELMGSFLSGSLPDGLLIDFRDDLSLGELRGHILVLGRNHYDGGPVGGYIEGWPDQARIVNAEGESFPMCVQDYYEPEGKADKLEAVLGTLEKNAAEPVWVVNHTSAYVESGYLENSFNVNSDVADYISSMSGKAGIVVLDFAGVDEYKGWNVAGLKLTDAVIAKNFRE